ncbi:MAG: hypothetical protein AAF704_11290 [Cyanobacteria bacterium P01_D01_bin.123]
MTVSYEPKMGADTLSAQLGLDATRPTYPNGITVANALSPSILSSPTAAGIAPGSLKTPS